MPGQPFPSSDRDGRPLPSPGVKVAPDAPGMNRTWLAPLSALLLLLTLPAASLRGADPDSKPLVLAPEVFAPEKLGLVLTAPLKFPRYYMGSRRNDLPLKPLLQRGALLFRTSSILGGGMKALGISCEYCHPGGSTNSKLNIPGLTSKPGSADITHHFWNPDNEDGQFSPSDILSLRGVRYTSPYGRDGREASLRAHTRMAIVTLDGPEPDPADVDALTAYIRSFEFLPNPYLDRFGGLTAKASSAALRGEEIFRKPMLGMGGYSCATCHPPLSHFTDNRHHDVYSGRMLDTPTLLGALNTGPYYHDGRFESLGQVVLAYDAVFHLGLTDQERGDLTEYLEAVGYEEDPFGSPAGED